MKRWTATVLLVLFVAGAWGALMALLFEPGFSHGFGIMGGVVFGYCIFHWNPFKI